MRRNWLSGSWSVSPPFASGSRRAATATSPTTGEKTREIATRVRKRPRRARPPPRGKPTLPGYRLSSLSKRVFEPNGSLRPSPRPRGDPLSARRADLPLHAPRPRIVVTTFFCTSSRATRFARRRAPQSGPNDAKIHTYGRTGLRPALGAHQTPPPTLSALAAASGPLAHDDDKHAERHRGGEAPGPSTNAGSVAQS